tara:strand:+ start:6989 stop:7396 length:408 start_codon:yes stop_codon:yes gene_type:complete
MKSNEQYYIDWLSSKEDLLSADENYALAIFVQENPVILTQWQLCELNLKLLRDSNLSFSASFNSQVLAKVHTKLVPLFDKSSLWVASLGIAASFLLMINLFVEQNTWSLEAMLGIANMDLDNTNLIFYINSEFNS